MKNRKESPSASRPFTSCPVEAQWSTSGPMRIPNSSSNRTLGIRHLRRTSEQSGAMATAAAITNTDVAVWYVMGASVWGAAGCVT